MIMRNIFEEDFSLKKRIAAGNIRLIRSPVLGGMFYDLMRTNFAGRAHGDKNVYAATDFYYCSAGRIICFGDWVENIDQIKEKSLRGEFLVSRNPRGIFLISPTAMYLLGNSFPPDIFFTPWNSFGIPT